MAGPAAPTGGRGTVARNQIRIIIDRMVVPARFRKDLGPQQHVARHVLGIRRLVGRQFHQEGLAGGAPEDLAEHEGDAARRWTAPAA